MLNVKCYNGKIEYYNNYATMIRRMNKVVYYMSLPRMNHTLTERKINNQWLESYNHPAKSKDLFLAGG